MKTVIENIELVLTFAGLAVIFLVSFLLDAGTPGHWPVLTLAAIAVSILHGFIFWIIRQRQRASRRKTLAEAQQMLKDVINNQLAVIRMTHELRAENNPAMEKANQRITESIGLISEALKDISEESLRRWQSKYGNRVTDEA